MKLKHLSIAIAMSFSFFCSRVQQGALSPIKAEAATTGGYSTATGSTDTAVTVTSLAELKKAFSAGKHHIIISGNIYGFLCLWWK